MISLQFLGGRFGCHCFLMVLLLLLLLLLVVVVEFFFLFSFLGQVSKHCPQTAKLGKLATASRQTKSTSPKLRCAQFLSLVTEDESGICDMIVFSWKIHGFVKVKGRSQLVDVYHTTPIFLSVLMGNQQLGEDPVSLTTWFIDLDTSVVG